MLWKKRNRLSWYLKFISTDINDLKLGELTELINTYKAMRDLANLAKPPPLKKTSSLKLNKTALTKKQAKLIKTELDINQKQILDCFKDEQQRLRDFIYNILKSAQNDYLGQYLATTEENYTLRLNLNSSEPSTEDTFHVEKKETFDSTYKWAKNDFIYCIDGLPKSSFKECPECTSWFRQATKTLKLYCSNKCASRFNIREKRKEQDN